MVELVKREAELTEAEHTNILRWEDDGGQAGEDQTRADRFTPEPAKRNDQLIGQSATKKLG